jgi:glycosyltransferase involved in cell wall biosynthesis
VLHGHAMRGGRYAGWASRWSGVPVVVSAHSTDAWKWLRPSMQLVAVSEAVRESLLRHGLARERVHLVYNGVPDAAPAPLSEMPSPPERPLRIGLIGRLDPVKGQDIALRALATLRRHGPVQLLLAGAGPAGWTDWLHAQALALGVAPWVDFLGQVDNVPALLAGLDLVIAPSRREALSLALIEAAAAGRPTVAARVGGIPEVVQDGVSGLLVPPEDVDSLCCAVEALVQDAPRRAALGLAARRVYESRFTVGAMGEAIESVYQLCGPA